MQEAAVRCGMVEWVAGRLAAEEGAEVLSSEAAEGLMGVLVNLVQCAAGRQACVEDRQRVLPVVMDMLEHEVGAGRWRGSASVEEDVLG